MPPFAVAAYRISGEVWSMAIPFTDPALMIPELDGFQLVPPLVLLYTELAKNEPADMYIVVGVLFWMATATAWIVLPRVPFLNDQLVPPLVVSMSPPCDVAA